jgi:hypothetical protein
VLVSEHLRQNIAARSAKIELKTTVLLDFSAFADDKCWHVRCLLPTHVVYQNSASNEA